MKFFTSIFKVTFWVILIAEALSLLGYFLPFINKIGFIIAILLVLILSWKKLEWGIYIILTELFIASKGYLFSWPIGNKNISVRLGIFLVFFLVWLIKAIKNKDLSLKKINLFWPYLIFLITIFAGALLGYLKGNGLVNIFYDWNGYLYFGLVFAFFVALKNWQKLQDVFQIFFASLLAMGIKTIFLLYIFSHHLGNLTHLYRWVRLTGVGEITLMSNNFYRIFFQSHVYYLFAFVIIAILLIRFRQKELGRKEYFGLIFLWLLSLIVLIISYSRSFWLGLIIAFCLLLIWLLFYEKVKFFQLIKILSLLIFSFLLSIAFIWLIINFPFPNPKRTITFSSLIEERTEIEKEPAAGSRFALLTPLKNKILTSPIIGSGFGATVTYKTEDPRALETNPNGLYTTFTFEWGYLDILTETGLIGLSVYLFLLFKIFWNGYKNKITPKESPMGKNLKSLSRVQTEGLKIKNYSIFDYVQIGLLLSFLVLLTVNFTTPYLNHPLGIGWIMLCSVYLSFNQLKTDV